MYVQTKLLGEREVVKYRAKGINGNIYRVGNLAFMSKNYRVQENIDDNAFFNWLKCLIKLRCITKGIDSVEISQTDLTAEAIVRLFDKKQIRNSVFHVFNPFKLSSKTIENGEKNLWKNL